MQRSRGPVARAHGTQPIEDKSGFDSPHLTSVHHWHGWAPLSRRGASRCPSHSDTLIVTCQVIRPVTRSACTRSR